MSRNPRAMSLVDDEIMEVPVDRKAVRVRVRVWRAKDQPAVVLVERLEGGQSPSLGTCKLATRIWRDLLHYHPLGMRYFEAEGDMIWTVTFDVAGVESRAVFIRPSYEFTTWVAIDARIEGRPPLTRGRRAA